jgi:hypothetical protein
MWRHVVAIFGLILIHTTSGCASDGDASTDVTVDGLQRLDRTRFEDAWVKPDAAFATYTKVYLAAPDVSYRRPPRSSGYASPPAPSNFALNESQMATFKRYLVEAFEEELSKSERYQVSASPGPDVLLIEPSVIDLVVEVPTARAPGRNNVYSTSTADITLMMELRDSESREILARVADRKQARHAGKSLNELSWSNSVSDSDAVRRVFSRWARILREQLDRAHTLAPPA